MANMIAVKSFYVFCLLFTIIVTVDSIRCYRCASTDAVTDPYQCNEYFEHSQLHPQSCDDVYNAQYCIKQVGRFEASGIKCFQCNSAWDMSCTDIFISDGSLEPESCDRIHEAQYCIKMTGGLGTKRFCSSADLGNYCNYVRQPGDLKEYRSCYFTCGSDGCNSAVGLKPLTYFLPLLFMSVLFLLK